MAEPKITLATLDSGKREEFASGARRDTREGKGRYDLISPLALRRLALVYERGAIKYGEGNYAKGIPIRRILDSAGRHLFQYLSGDRTEDHLGALAWNAFAAMHMEEQIIAGNLPQELYDVPDYTPKKGANEEAPPRESDGTPVQSLDSASQSGGQA